MEGIKGPTIYEVNVLVWLREVEQYTGRRLNLADVPGEHWDALIPPGVDYVWLMGVWERSPTGAQIAWENDAWRREFVAILPDLSRQDVVGSPYCIRRYGVEEILGGAEGLAVARKALAKRGCGLILDFVPNHTAPDAPLVFHSPDSYIGGN
ncbi:MAG: alpha-amylase, partial [Syntrophales bacterium]|nr:alpha-amylase [Syntrophales bacterium]